MLVDLLSTCNYVSYNIEVARAVGLKAAIYISEITNISSKAIRKKKTNGKFFTVDREYLENRTTISVKEQQDIEKDLVKLGILEKSKNSPNDISLNIDVLASIMMSANEKLIKDISSIMKTKANKKTKQESIADNLKTNIITANEKLRNAYYDWIDSVIAKDGRMSKTAVLVGERTVNEFSTEEVNGELIQYVDKALRVIEIASINGYRDMTWAINRYNDSPQVKNYKNNNTNQKIDMNNVKVYN